MRKCNLYHWILKDRINDMYWDEAYQGWRMYIPSQTKIFVIDRGDNKRATVDSIRSRLLKMAKLPPADAARHFREFTIEGINEFQDYPAKYNLKC